MTVFYKLPKRIRISIGMLGVYIGLFTLLRIVFMLVFIEEIQTLSSTLLIKSIFIGLRFDIRLAIYIVLPFLLLSILPIFNFNFIHKVWKSYWFIIFAIVLCMYVADIGYYSYLNNRLDASIIGLAKNFYISINMIWETYPVIPFIFFFIVYLWFFSIIIKKLHVIVDDYSIIISKSKSTIMHVLVIFIFLGTGWGKLSGYPFRWSDAFYSTNHIANQLAINPILYFLNTYLWRAESYDVDNVKKYYPFIAKHLGIHNINDSTYSLNRFIEPSETQTIKPNVIIFFLETFPTYKIGYFGNPLNPTPNFDSIARQSIIFTNFFVPKFSTAGSIFSAMTGLPDVSTTDKSSTRDPLAHKQHFLLNELEGYKKHFFIGGSANWGDMGGFFRGNVDQMEIYEEGSYSASAINAWGISDYDLMMEAHNIIKEEEEPFFSIILTAGNHSPHTVPIIDKFKRVKFTNEHKKYGFSHENELNAFRFMDFALGEFIHSAKEENYYNNTIFVILGDHGVGHHSQHNNYGALSFHNFHVPLTIYSPGLKITHEEIDEVVSSIDLMPTLMGLLNAPYTNTSLGRDLLSNRSYTGYSFLFTASNSTYGLISNDYFVQTDVMGQHLIYNNKDATLINNFNPEIEKMIKLNEGYYHISRYIRYHNE